MSFFHRSSTTTWLLGLIALLLLVLVVRNGVRKTPNETAETLGSVETLMQGQLPPGHPPAGSNAPAGMESAGEAAQMVLASMKCPSGSGLTLDSPECGGAQADERRAAVKELSEKQKSHRAVFDAVVSRFGEDSLTPQALQIRQMTRKPH